MKMPKKWAGLGSVLNILLILSLTFFAACSSDDAPQEGDGQLVISLTDAPGDFSNYVVQVKSLTLTKENGVQVETLPVSTTVDFAQYTEMTEFFTIATIPAGRYVKAEMVLDYSNANIQVEDDSGATVSVGDIVDADNQVITELKVGVRLQGRRALTILPGVPAHLSLDFDLQASNQVDLTVSPPTLIVEPFLLAELQLDRQREHRLRGLLAGVNTAENRYSVFVHPFLRRFAGNDRPFGRSSVHVDDQTMYEIDEQVYQGAAGLAQMEGLASLSKVITVGRIRLNPLRFVATEVYAGTSVPGADRDGVRGTVSGRDGNVLTVLGATLIQQDGSVVFNQSVTVNLDEFTSVTKQASSDVVGIDDINVGQRVTILGVLSNSNPNELVLDATGETGHARMLMSQITGRVNSVGANSLVLNLRSINGRSATRIFDLPTEADPASFNVATGDLDLGGLGSGIPVRLRGFVSAFQPAAGEDFQAVTLLDISNLPANLDVVWANGTQTPFVAIDNTAITVDISAADLARIVQGGIPTALSANPQLLPGAGNQAYVVKFDDTLTIHSDFGVLVEDLNNRMLAPNAMFHIRARGSYSYDTSSMSSGFIGVVIKGPANGIQ